MLRTMEPLLDPRFRRLFAAQVVALVGTGLLTVALGLVAYDIAGGHAGAVLGTALAIKMVAYVGVAPVAAALTARFDRKSVLVSADLARVAVASVLPFVGQAWQIYVLVFVLQSASATFTPAFQSVIPAILGSESAYTRGLSLSRLAYDLESIVSPMIAAALLTVVTYHSLFVGTAVGFLGSMILVLATSIPRVSIDSAVPFRVRVTEGVRRFGREAELRGLAAMNLVDAAVTSLVVVNTVVFARVLLGGPGWSLAFLLGCFGAGSIVVALCVPWLLVRVSDRTLMVAGCIGASSVLVLAAVLAGLEVRGALGWISVAVLWVAAGAAASAIGTPSARVVRRAAGAHDPSPLFTAQFSLSHACFLVTYPIAGWLGASAGQVFASVVLALVATLGTIAAVMLWDQDKGGGSGGRTSRSRTQPRAFSRT